MEELSQEEDMYVNQAILVIYNDDIGNLAEIIIDDCKKIDDVDKGEVPTDELKYIFEKHTGIFTQKEYTLLLKKIQADYPRDFPYAEINNYLFKFKVDAIKGGLMENNVSKLEMYLRRLFEIFDPEKTGRITTQVMMEALESAEKILLSKMQLYILRNFVNKNEQGLIEYHKESKFLA